MEEVTSKKSDICTPSRAHHSDLPVSTQGAVPSTSASTVRMPSTAPGDSLPSSNSESDNDNASIDLTICSNVSFEARDGHPGVRYTADSDETSEWTPVVGRRRKRPQLPSFVLRRFPPDHPIHQRHASHSDADTSSEEDEELTIPQSANVCFSVVDGTPGLHITTRNTSKWTPIATRTRSKCKQYIASIK